MEKVGLVIVTYTINFGTFLQAFATQNAVRSLGYETEILNINSVISDVSKSRKKYFAGQLLNFAEVKSYIPTVSAIIQKKLNKEYRDYITNREQCFLKFGKEYFDIGPVCDSWSGLAEYCKGFSSILVGSDQLWRPANIAGDYYTLSFVPDEINKVAYATSFGLKEIRDNQKETASRFLSRIEHLSSREESGVEIIKNLTGREDATIVCDPTLLLTEEDWDHFIDPEPVVSGDYILMYLLNGSKEQRNFVKQLSKMTGCKIVAILHGAGYIAGDSEYADDALLDVGPFEFLNLFKNAKYICTDSFHGCVFSSVFNKNFFSFKRFSDNDSMSTNDRVTNLLRRLGLSERLLTDYSLTEIKDIDYNGVNERIEEFRRLSFDYLEKALRNDMGIK